MYNMKKGQITEIGWTTFFLIVVIFIVIMGIIGWVGLRVNNLLSGESTLSYDYIVSSNAPYMTASLLSNSLMGDRQFIEHATEIMATQNITNASSENMVLFLKKFMDNYNDNKFISIDIKRVDDSDTSVFYVDNVPKKCGDDLTGFCVGSTRLEQDTGGPANEKGYKTTYVGCTDGRIPIDPELYMNNDNKCTLPDEVCCVEDIQDGRRNSGISCGANAVCDFSGGCSSGRTQIDDVNNKCIKNGASGVCCVPLQGDILVSSGFAYRAEIPLLYKDSILGKVTVTIR